jgi:DNA-binding CsgD family transcriptional regulator
LIDGANVKLTKREREILVLLTEDMSTSEMADGLFVAKRTVDFHVANLHEKFNVKSSRALAVIALCAGLVSIETATQKIIERLQMRTELQHAA